MNVPIPLPVPLEWMIEGGRRSWPAFDQQRQQRPQLGQVFAKLKAHLRAVAPRTLARLWAAVGPALATVSPTECAQYVRHAGYRLATAA